MSINTNELLLALPVELTAAILHELAINDILNFSVAYPFPKAPLILNDYTSATSAKILADSLRKMPSADRAKWLSAFTSTYNITISELSLILKTLQAAYKENPNEERPPYLFTLLQSERRQILHSLLLTPHDEGAQLLDEVLGNADIERRPYGLSPCTVLKEAASSPFVTVEQLDIILAQLDVLVTSASFAQLPFDEDFPDERFNEQAEILNEYKGVLKAVMRAGVATADQIEAVLNYNDEELLRDALWYPRTPIDALFARYDNDHWPYSRTRAEFLVDIARHSNITEAHFYQTLERAYDLVPAERTKILATLAYRTDVSELVLDDIIEQLDSLDPKHWKNVLHAILLGSEANDRQRNIAWKYIDRVPIADKWKIFRDVGPYAPTEWIDSIFEYMDYVYPSRQADLLWKIVVNQQATTAHLTACLEWPHNQSLSNRKSTFSAILDHPNGPLNEIWTRIIAEDTPYGLTRKSALVAIAECERTTGDRLDDVLRQLDTLPPADWKDILVAVCRSPQATIRHHQKALERLNCFERPVQREILSAMAWRCEPSIVDGILNTYLWYCNTKDWAPILRSFAKRTDITIGQLSTILDRIKEIPSWNEDKVEAFAAVAGNVATTEPMLHDILSFIETRPAAENVFRARYIPDIFTAIAKSSATSEPLLHRILAHVNDLPTGWPRARVLGAMAQSPALTEQLAESIFSAVDAIEATDNRRSVLRELANSNCADKTLSNNKTLLDNILDRYTDFSPGSDSFPYPSVQDTYANIASSEKILERQHYSILARLHQLDASSYINSWDTVLSAIAFRANPSGHVTANTPKLLDVVLQYVHGLSPWNWGDVLANVAHNPYVLSHQLDRVLLLLDKTPPNTWLEALKSVAGSSSATATHLIAVIERVDKMSLVNYASNKAFVRQDRHAVLAVVLNRVDTLSDPADKKNVLLALCKSNRIGADQIDKILERLDALPNAEDRRDVLIVIAQNKNTGDVQLSVLIDRLDDKAFNIDDKCTLLATIAENQNLGSAQWERVLERLDILDDASLKIILHAAARSTTIKETQLRKVLERVDEGNLPHSEDRRGILIAAALNRNMTAPLFDILLRRINELAPADRPAVLIAAASNSHAAHRQLAQCFEHVHGFTLPEDRSALLAAIGRNAKASTSLLEKIYTTLDKLTPAYRHKVFIAIAGNRNASQERIIELLKHMPSLSPVDQGALLRAAARGGEPLAELLIHRVILQIRHLPNTKDQIHVVDTVLDRIHELPNSASKRMVLCAVALLSHVITEAQLLKIVRHTDGLPDTNDKENVLNAVLKRVANFAENPTGILLTVALNSACRKEQFIRILARLDAPGEHRPNEEQSKQVLDTAIRRREAPLDIMLQRIQAAFNNSEENQLANTTKPYGLQPAEALACLCRSKHLEVEQLDTVLTLMNGLSNAERATTCRALAGHSNLTAEQSIIFIKHLDNSNFSWNEHKELLEKTLNVPNAPIDTLLEQASKNNWFHGIWPQHLFTAVFQSKQITKAQIGIGLGFIDVLSATVSNYSESPSDREKAIQGLFNHIAEMSNPQERRDTIAFIAATRDGDYLCLFQIVVKHFNAYDQPAVEDRRNLRDILIQGLSASNYPAHKDAICDWMIWQIDHLSDQRERSEHFVSIINSPAVSPKMLVEVVRSADKLPDAESASVVLNAALLRADEVNNGHQQASILISVMDCRHATKTHFIQAIKCAGNSRTAENTNVLDTVINSVLDQLSKLPTAADKAEVLIETIRCINISRTGYVAIFNSSHVTGEVLDHVIEQAGSLNSSRQAQVLRAAVYNLHVTNAHLDIILARLTPQNISAEDRADLLTVISRSPAVSSAQIKIVDAYARSLPVELAQNVFTAITAFHVLTRHNHIYPNEPIKIEYKVDEECQLPAGALGFCKGIWEKALGIKQFSTHHKEEAVHVYTICVKRQAVAAKIWGKWEADIKKHDNYVDKKTSRLPTVRKSARSITLPADGEHLEISKTRRITQAFTGR